MREIAKRRSRTGFRSEAVQPLTPRNIVGKQCDYDTLEMVRRPSQDCDRHDQDELGGKPKWEQIHSFARMNPTMKALERQQGFVRDSVVDELQRIRKYGAERAKQHAPAESK